MNYRIPTAVAASILVLSAVAQARLSRAGDAQVQFTANGPAGLRIVGTTGELVVSETEKEVVLTVPLKGLDTKIDLRNKHMREKYLEVDKYPNAELRVAKDAVQRNTPSGKATGVLTLHGQSKPMSFTYSTRPDGSVTGAVRVNMKDFGITQPGYAGVTVKPDVDVNVSFRVTDG